MNTSTLRTEPRPGHAALRSGRTGGHSGQAWHLTFTTHGREPLFEDFQAARVVSACLHDSIAISDGSVLAWVVMPDHVHCLLQLDGDQPLHVAVGGLKSGSARRVNRALGRTGPLWTRAYHDHAIRSGEDLRSVARYIVANPLRAGLVQRIGDYPFWNAVWMSDPDPSPL
ncbi:REP-associated tyrosine transposase [Luteimonas sp. A478]